MLAEVVGPEIRRARGAVEESYRSHIGSHTRKVKMAIGRSRSRGSHTPPGQCCCYCGTSQHTRRHFSYHASYCSCFLRGHPYCRSMFATLRDIQSLRADLHLHTFRYLNVPQCQAANERGREGWGQTVAHTAREDRAVALPSRLLGRACLTRPSHTGGSGGGAREMLLTAVC